MADETVQEADISDPELTFRYGWMLTVRNIALGILPAAYVIGFMAWGRHLYDYRLGWVSAPPERLLALGFAALVLGLMVAFALVMAHQAYRKACRRGWRSTWVLLVYPVAGALGVLACYFIGQGFDMLEENTYSPWLYAMQGVLLGVAVPALAALLNRLFAKDKHLHKDEEDVTVLVVGTFVMVAMISFPLIFMEDLAPEFGGTFPEVAILEIEPDGLTPVVRRNLLENVNETSGFGYTVPVFVLATTSDSFLVRNGTMDPRAGPLFEIPRRSVSAVGWFY
ncbi:MAG: hypothetical protein QOD77_111 [Thermoplasmata archaeon]|jgi:hypothetical protein|nr:hypothetical protein [Thermoplasmata archaeon]